MYRNITGLARFIIVDNIIRRPTAFRPMVLYCPSVPFDSIYYRRPYHRVRTVYQIPERTEQYIRIRWEQYDPGHTVLYRTGRYRPQQTCRDSVGKVLAAVR